MLQTGFIAFLSLSHAMPALATEKEFNTWIEEERAKCVILKEIGCTDFN